MSKTFAQLGIPFPLFEAPTDQAGEYCGLRTCSLCGRAGVHCFELGIGCAVMSDCPACGTATGLDADDREDGACRQCRASVPVPENDDASSKLVMLAFARGTRPSPRTPNWG